MTADLIPRPANGRFSGAGQRSGREHERHREHLLDEALKESFPASDPPSIAWPARAGW
jgi:hypothetical protein